ncbi:TPA: threonine/serine exporter family protein [Enterococcus faecium]|nr:threonine/serine exporter family protein [Enterococcus faecium]
MGTIFIQFSFSFLATAAFAVITNVPRRSLLGSLGVAFISDLFSKRLKMPVTIFNIPGMVPLVPGGLAYQAVRNLVTESYREAAHYAVQAIMIAGAIALGLVLSEVFNHNIRNFKVKRDAIMMKRKKRLFK